MVRSIVIVGMILAFVAAAFMRPSTLDSNAQAHAALSALVGAAANPVLVQTSIQRVQRTLSTRDPEHADSTLTVLRDVAPDPIETAKRAASVLGTSIAAPSTSSFWDKTKNESDDEDFVDYLHDVEWAARKKNLRLCSDLATNARKQFSAPTPGDYLALCLAKVTGDTARCAQINGERAPLLRKLCTEELAT